jgi:uncharacterized membrane protein YoaK (UPF0700 family)
MKISLPVLLSLNAGYLDTAGFLALRGLFTAHVTGNFVTFGAAVVQGSSGALAKLIALPVFCFVVVVTRLIARRLEPHGVNVLRTMLSVKVVLLILGAVLAIALGPFTNGDALGAVLTGMCFVSGMAIQNAAHRIHFPSAPPTTLMTGTTTQIMIDLADRIHGLTPEQAPVIRARLIRMSAAVAAFALGCGGGALLFYTIGQWCFAVVPVLGAITPFLDVPAPIGAKA